MIILMAATVHVQCSVIIWGGARTGPGASVRATGLEVRATGANVRATGLVRAGR